jgi:hypothetical protein
VVSDRWAVSSGQCPVVRGEARSEKVKSYKDLLVCQKGIEVVKEIRAVIQIAYEKQ